MWIFSYQCSTYYCNLRYFYLKKLTLNVPISESKLLSRKGVICIEFHGRISRSTRNINFFINNKQWDEGAKHVYERIHYRINKILDFGMSNYAL